jgi:hypothetical protein
MVKRKCTYTLSKHIGLHVQREEEKLNTIKININSVTTRPECGQCRPGQVQFEWLYSQNAPITT